MKINIKQRIKNLNMGINDVWFPLYEAVVNSYQSIQEKGNINTGNITIKISRKPTVLMDEIGDVDTIEIIDNGIGFDDKNYDAFLTSDTDNKIAIGGKGVGRLTWAKVFTSAKITSTYLKDEKFMTRDFVFNNEGIRDHKNEEARNDIVESGTQIKLRNMKQEYSENTKLNLKDIAQELMRHISVYLINNEGVKVDLVESKTKDTINLNYEFFNKYILKQESQELYIDEERFNVRHIFSVNKLTKKTNIAYFCAQNRVVESVELDKHIELPETYLIEGKELYYNCYITSKFLDEDVSSERLAFNNFIYEKKEKSGFAGLNGYERINDLINNFLFSDIKKITDIKERNIKTFISDEQPQFGYLYHREDTRERLNNIPYNTTSDRNKLYAELRKIDNEIYADTRKKVENDEVTEEQIKLVVDTIDYTSRSSLAEYIVRRKLLIELLESKLGTTDDKYERESTMHKILFPMGEKLDTINYDSHNLWLIDERLSYSYNGFSDKPLRQIAKVESSDRPDLLLINSFTNESNKNETSVDSITIVEIKRPGRDNFNEGSPEDQIIKYIRKLKNAGQINGYNNQVYGLAPNVLFTCYVIGDLTREMKEKLEDSDFDTIDNGNKYFKYHDKHNAYFEFISFNKLVKDAKLRNKIFNKKLNLVE